MSIPLLLKPTWSKDDLPPVAGILPHARAQQLKIGDPSFMVQAPTLEPRRAGAGGDFQRKGKESSMDGISQSLPAI